MKINVIGTSGSGKSTVAMKLSEKLGIPFLEMDEFYWLPEWEERSEEEFLDLLSNALDQEHWVLAGNYHARSSHVKWKDVDMVVWVDYSFSRTLYQAIKRAMVRVITREALFAGNVESLGKLFSRDSIVWWTIKTYSDNREKYLSLMSQQAYSHIQFIQFIQLKSPIEVDRFLKELKAPIDQEKIKAM